MDLSIILPTYNEAGNIVALIKEIKNTLKIAKIKGEIIVVDDDSPDGTARKVKQKYQPRKVTPCEAGDVKVIVRKKDRGLAKSILTGINKARGEIILVMDTDFNHDPKEIPQMVRRLEVSDLVIGSRYIKGGGMENRLRYWLSCLFNIYVRVILGVPVHDNLSGFFAMRRKDLQGLPLQEIFTGFGEYFMRLIYHAYRRNYRTSEVPVYYKNRVFGESKSHFLQMFISYSLVALRLRFISPYV